MEEFRNCYVTSQINPRSKRNRSRKKTPDSSKRECHTGFLAKKLTEVYSTPCCMYLYGFYSYTVRFTEKTGKIPLFTRSKFSPLLLFSFRPRVKSASRDQVVKQEFISQSKRSPWPWDSSYYRQLSRLPNQNTLKMARRLARTKGCFLRIFTAALAEENKSIPNALYEKTRAEEAGKAGKVFLIIFTSTTKYSCCREVTAVPPILFP